MAFPALAALLLVCGARAAVTIRIAPGPAAPAALARTRAVVDTLLERPSERAANGGFVFEAPRWASGRDAAGLRELEAVWGARLRVEEDGPRSEGVAARSREAVLKASASLGSAPDLSSKARQDLFYDGAVTGEAGAVQGSRGAPRPPADARSARRPTAVPPAPARPEAALSWGRAGREVLRGAFGVVKDAINWQGLAVAAASVALVTVAPVAVYAILGLGAVTAGWTIGKALARGWSAYKRKDAEGFYGASRELGRGTLTLGLTLLGSRHPPTSLKPHFPRTAGEWQAIAAAVDDEPIIVLSLLRKD